MAFNLVYRPALGAGPEPVELKGGFDFPVVANEPFKVKKADYALALVDRVKRIFPADAETKEKLEAARAAKKGGK